METNNSILIIGKPKSGKTTFLTQFYTRVRKNKSKVKWWKAPQNIKAIEDAEKRLSRGEEPQSTPADKNEELILPIQIEGTNLELICPDYGGEQVKNMVELMEVNEKWKSRINSCNSWVLFIRANSIINYYDLSNSGYEYLERKKSEGDLSSPLSEQIQLIELLQVLLFIKGKSIKQIISDPTLIISITCWDELNTNKTPSEFMQETLPLLFNYIETNWKKESFKIVGLSSQEFSLNTSEAKERYLDELPENFGYLITPEGSKTKDLTLLVEQAIQW